ncbi:hypothetical protein [Legionella waltersii]|uniref:Transmembrane protein n=1 Tax=Legionella waltersii TaxID=66969 RepID=A0A0W1AD34_9GAMM|nr:hypothetical protein [Legionella waltersii]KTD79262.1 hypothetical protein Lwal_1334 [Legionella waltersii]SNV12768.1 Uncharacterised protein [Legionella waltersii]
MFSYYKKGWKGELRFGEVLFGEADVYLIEGGAAYIGFYILLTILIFMGNPLSLNNVMVLPFLLYGIAFYVWLLKAFWGSANQCKSKLGAILIRVFTVFLPILSLVLFVLLLVYYIVQGIIQALS